MKRMLFLILAFLAVPSHAEPISIPSGNVSALISALQSAGDGTATVDIHLAQSGIYVFQRPWQAGASVVLPPITANVRIHGNGSQLVIYSEAALGFIEVEAGARLGLTQMTLSGATATVLSNFGEAALWQVRIEDNFAEDQPAAIDNFGTMRIDDSRIAYNTVSGNSEAGAIRNRGRLDMHDGSLSNNQLFPSRGGHRAAAALLNEGIARLSRVELGDNEAVLNHPVSASALANAGQGRLELQHSRVIQGNTPALAQLPGDAGVTLNQTVLSSVWVD